MPHAHRHDHVVKSITMTVRSERSAADADAVAATDRDHVLMSMERLTADDEPDDLASDTRPVRWTVWRQDDNGNRFEVARKDARAEAEALAAVMEVRGHKHTYWGGRATG